jgi:hypothetical protein
MTPPRRARRLPGPRDHWPQAKLIVSLVAGRRDADTAAQLFTDFYGRTGGHLPQLIVTDEYAPYKAVVLDTCGVSRE